VERARAWSTLRARCAPNRGCETGEEEEAGARHPRATEARCVAARLTRATGATGAGNEAITRTTVPSLAAAGAEEDKIGQLLQKFSHQ
jgi:hypothetical protein